MEIKQSSVFNLWTGKSVKRILSMLLCILFLAGSVSKTKAAEEAPQGYSKIAQSTKAAFYFNDKDYTFIIQNAGTGFSWASAVNNDFYDTSKLNDQWKGNVKSLFNFTYTNLKTGDGTTITASSAGQKPTVTTKSIKNGISLTYDFKDLKLGVTVDLSLEDNALTARIANESLKEEGNFGFVSIELLPFFGAAKDNQDGYILCPDGSGALMDFNDPVHYGAKKRAWDIYGADITDYMADEQNRPAPLPVYGIKQGNNALFAIITEGEYDTTINLTPTGNVVDLNRISPEFICRRYFIDPRTKKKVVKKYDKKTLGSNHTVRYIFLDGDNANYSGMANTYRNYLLNEVKVPKRITANDKIPLGLDLFMGVEEKKLIFNSFVPMTTFDQAKTILEKFKNSGVDAIQTDLLGWTKRGERTSPLYFPANGKIGGDSGLKKLEDYAKTSNVKLFLETNLEFINGKMGGFSKRNDVVYQASGLILTNPKKTFFFFNPFAAKSVFENSILPKAKKTDVIGINFSWFGDQIYYDYNKKHPSTKEQTAATWNEIMDKSSKELGNVGVVTGNAYSLKYADRLFEISSKDHNFFSTSSIVPFYQMVVHGLIPYSSVMQEAGNLTPDFTEQKLKWVEYGYMPYFQLTYESPKLLKYTTYSDLFTSKYDEWLDTAAGTYKEFNERLSGVWSQYIVKHEKIVDDVYKVTYDNGTQVYINYRSIPMILDGNTIKAKDYLVVEKGGKVK